MSLFKSLKRPLESRESSQLKRPRQNTEKIRFPSMAKGLASAASNYSARDLSQLGDLSIFTLSTRQLTQQLKDEIFGDEESKTLRKLIPSAGSSASHECERAGVICRSREKCYLCDDDIDCDLPHGYPESKECDHLIPFVIAVVLVGIETTRNVYKRFLENGANIAVLRKKVNKVYFWTHGTCNNKKRDKNPAKIYKSKQFKKLRAAPNGKVIEEIITGVCEVRNTEEKVDELVESFSEKVQVLCDFVNIEIGALYELFTQSGIPDTAYIPLIIEYYKLVIKLYAFDESVQFLESLENSTTATYEDDESQEVFVIPEETKTRIIRKKQQTIQEKQQLENELFQAYQRLKREFFSKLREGRVIIIDYGEITEAHLMQIINANSGPLFFPRDSMPSLTFISRSRAGINRMVYTNLISCLSSMKRDGVVMDQELLFHLISLIQFAATYRMSKLYDVPFYFNGVLLRKSKVSSYVDLTVDESTEESNFREIFCQSLFTLLEKMGWVANFNYKDSPVYLKLKNDYLSFLDFGKNLCNEIFRHTIEERMKTLLNYSPAELYDDQETIALTGTKPRDYEHLYEFPPSPPVSMPKSSLSQKSREGVSMRGGKKKAKTRKHLRRQRKNKNLLYL